ncbi:hypothetical protein FA10DRAFT_166454 [Acaromyces ingoldii]|uniref:Uncharacterized protein n=1 Tax=Acaromyces ingoldii TaxID=215250 RepID=A0A316YHD7_9BASI|nr:hypothetical protein FA10DRAFT_166454 [Acaromyces ingoldii]PWN88561.1 hypothetical protein FA10DRAFT_166454 [Acaromyces ingoldii]
MNVCCLHSEAHRRLFARRTSRHLTENNLWFMNFIHLFKTKDRARAFFLEDPQDRQRPIARSSMPSKSKKKGGASRPAGPAHTDSLRKDIEAARTTERKKQSSQDPFSDGDGNPDDGLDIADQLLASLDARDAAAAGLAQPPPAKEEKSSHHLAVPQADKPRRSSGMSGESGQSGSSSSSASHRGPGEMLRDIFGGHHHSKSPPPIEDGATDGAGSGSGGATGAAAESTSMKRGGSISKSMGKLFGHSPGKDAETSPTLSPSDSNSTADGAKKKVPRQKARKVSLNSVCLAPCLRRMILAPDGARADPPRYDRCVGARWLRHAFFVRGRRFCRPTLPTRGGLHWAEVSSLLGLGADGGRYLCLP